MKKIVIHIGRHKTGTSSIQRFLKDNKEKLSEHGIHYPTDNIGHKLAHHSFAQLFSSINHRGRTLEESLQVLNPEIVVFKSFLVEDKINLISSEAFQNCNPDLLALAFSDYDVKVCFYLRNEITYLASSYAQKVQATSYCGSIHEFYDSFNVDYEKFVNRWRVAFNNLQFSVFSKDILLNENVVDDFLVNMLGISDVKLFNSTSNISENPSLSYPLILAKLYINKNYHIPSSLQRKLYSFFSELALRPTLRGKYCLPESIVKKYMNSDGLSSVQWQKNNFGREVFDYKEYVASDVENVDFMFIVDEVLKEFNLKFKGKVKDIEKYIQQIDFLTKFGRFAHANTLVSEAINLFGYRPRLKAIIKKNRLSYTDCVPDDSAWSSSESSISTKFESVCVDSYIIATEDDGRIEFDRPINGTEHYIFRNNIRNRPKRDIVKLESGYLSIDLSKKYKVDYYFFDSNKKYIESISSGKAPFLLNDVIEVNKNVGFIEDRFTKFNICHLISDKLPRVFELEKYEDIDEYVLFSNNEYITAVTDLLRINLIDFDGFNGNLLTLKCERIYLSSSSSYSKSHPAQFCYSPYKKLVDVLKSSLNSSSSSMPKRFFIDRSMGKTRNVLNQDSIDEVLTANSIEKVRLEELSFQEQISLFNQAELVIGVHGAGMTNVAFCKPDTQVIEILPPLCATSSFWIPAVFNSLNYNAFIATDPDMIKVNYNDWKHQPELYNRRDVYINCDIFSDFLKDYK